MEAICRFIGVFIVFLSILTLPAKARDTKVLKWTEEKKETVEPVDVNDLVVICYVSSTKRSLFSLWTTATFRVVSSGEHTLYTGPSHEAIEQDYNNAGFVNFWSLAKPWASDSVPVSPFDTTCVGVTGSKVFTVELRIQAVDLWLIARLCVGLILFLTAPRLCGNILCYYTAGISFGVLASFLVIVFVLSRFIPKKSGVAVFLMAGFSLTAYLAQVVWSQAQALLKDYYCYVIAYFVIAGCASFAVCYYKFCLPWVQGPVSNPRLLTLIQWCIQLLGVALMYNGCQVPQVSWTVVALAVLVHCLPSCGASSRLRRLWQRWFPPKIRLLTEAEYEEQGRVETAKALERLRAYCHSPDCNAWKTLVRLRSPERFASWVGCNSFHVTDDETAEHHDNSAAIPPDRFLDDDLDDEAFPDLQRGGFGYRANQTMNEFCGNRTMDNIRGGRERGGELRGNRSVADYRGGSREGSGVGNRSMGEYSSSRRVVNSYSCLS